MLYTIIIFVIILSLLILIHELGHFVVAKLFGVQVDEFGIGFPPKITDFKRGTTSYSINWIPLGGFVKLKGEQGENPKDHDSFINKKIYKRILIVSAGVVSNFVLAAVLITIGFMIGLPQIVDQELPNAKISDHRIQIVMVLENSPAYEAKLQAGDIILSVNNQAFETAEKLKEYIKKQKENEISMLIKRGEEILTVDVVPEILKQTNNFGIGVALAETALVSYPFHIAIIKGATYTFILTKTILIAFYDLLHNLIVSHEVSVELAGPVGIAVLTGRAAKLGFVYLLQFMALLSLNLAIINFLPLPALDGGKTLFIIIEKIRGKPINQRVENFIHSLGFALLLLLVLVVTFRDILKLF